MFRTLTLSRRFASGFALLIALLLFSGTADARNRHRATRYYRVQATAYCINGTTADGSHTQTGIVAADPALFPLGTRIRLTGAGVSGTYLVSDTGPKIVGRHIDIFMPSKVRARRFGRKIVQVRVIEWGDSDRQSGTELASREK